MIVLKIALDWTPNINHIGIFIAKELGFYSEVGIDVRIISPLEDNYTITPGKKLELGIADFAIAPFETVISLNNKQNIVDAIAVYAILQEDISSVVTLASSQIDNPQQLDGKIYASYKARYEDHIVREMIKNDGGSGNLNIIYPEKLGIWNTLLTKQADATWIFNNWEAVEAETKGIALNKFSLKAYNIPYCYSPIILATKHQIDNNKAAYTNFIQATKKGYLYAKENKAVAIDILEKQLTPYDKANINLSKALDATILHIGDDVTCGLMQPERVNAFLEWLVKHELEHSSILGQTLFTNELVAKEYS
ncbi:ABC transporter substrate-binding protein [Parasediminibacterium paludis]|uniref:Thiamine pyrimidine synthase n=1 Tax=Parasediminibacterium paludis TaxID=908966 RepID=A0ABV8PW33_9BACT